MSGNGAIVGATTSRVHHLVVKEYHSWDHRSGPEDVRVHVYTYESKEAALDAMPRLMLDRIVGYLKEYGWFTKSESNPEFDAKYGEWWPAFVREVERTEGDKERLDLAEIRLAERCVNIKEVYEDFMKRCEYAARLEDIGIKTSTLFQK
jgi:hypothetical protein